jgi:hypothetical protein
MIEKGAPWGEPTDAKPDASVVGDDATLARVVADGPGSLIRFIPDASSDLARAVGLSSHSPAKTEVPLDALRFETGAVAVNMVVSGAPPDRQRWWHRRRRVTVHVDDRVLHDGPATCVLVANGQYLRGNDAVPRGHPNDGRAEVQVYALRSGARAEMRRRFASGAQIPHPDIRTGAGRAVRVAWAYPTHLEVDGEQRPAAAAWTIEVSPSAYRLLV